MHSDPNNSDEEQLTLTLHQKSSSEVLMYLSEPEITENPLLWWKMNSFRYPLLSKVAKNIYQYQLLLSPQK